MTPCDNLHVGVPIVIFDKDCALSTSQVIKGSENSPDINTFTPYIRKKELRLT
jgi:hypothetical protein